MGRVYLKALKETDDFQSFFSVAREVYRNDPIWVPEEKRFTKEMITALFKKPDTITNIVVAYENDIPAARGIAVYRKNQFHPADQAGWIGMVEFPYENRDTAGILLDHLEDKLKQAGVKRIITPKTGSMEPGLLVEKFDYPQTVLTTHNPEYYLDFYFKSGYQIKETCLTFCFSRKHAKQIQIKLPGFMTRSMDPDRLEKEITIFNSLQNAIFEEREGYLRRSLEEDRSLIQSFQPFLDKDLIIIAEDLSGKPVGILICLPDIYQAYMGLKVDRVRFISIGCLPTYTKKGIGILMVSHLINNLIKNPEYKSAEASWILGSNKQALNMLSRFNPEKGREFVFLEKVIQA